MTKLPYDEWVTPVFSEDARLGKGRHRLIPYELYLLEIIVNEDYGNYLEGTRFNE